MIAAMNLLESPGVAEVRRNHGLEHATIHVLSERMRPIRLAGRSTERGFYLYGSVSAEDIRSAVDEALGRFARGEAHWAVHPGCGTNYVSMGLLAGAAAFVTSAVAGRRAHWWDRFSNALLGGLVGVMAGGVVGPWLQANVTTSPDMRRMRVKGIRRADAGPIRAHFVETERV